jgi:hypothetical protein
VRRQPSPAPGRYGRSRAGPPLAQQPPASALTRRPHGPSSSVRVPLQALGTRWENGGVPPSPDRHGCNHGSPLVAPPSHNLMPPRVTPRHPAATPSSRTGSRTP